MLYTSDASIRRMVVCYWKRVATEKKCFVEVLIE